MYQSFLYYHKYYNYQRELKIQPIAVGNKPDTEMLRGTVELDRNGADRNDQECALPFP